MPTPRSVSASRATASPSTPWLRRFWWFLLAVQISLLINAVQALLRGVPDAYPNQHLRLAANACTGICLGVSFLVRRPAIQYAAIGLGAASVVCTLALLS